MDTNSIQSKMSYKQFNTSIILWLFKAILITTISSIFFSLLGFVQWFEPGYLALLIVSSILEIVMVIVLIKKISDLSVESARKYFYVYSVLNGMTLSLWLNMVAPAGSILAFGITCAFFGLLYTITQYTKYDFLSVGRICSLCLPLLLVVYIIFFFVQLPFVYYFVIFMDLLLFTGLTLHDMKKAKYLYETVDQHEVESLAMFCALELYLDFINIFIDIISIIADGI